MKLLMHVMPWFGDGGIHRMDSYLSNDPNVVKNQINVMMTARIYGLQVQGVIMTWQGPGATFQHSAVQQWNTQCQQRGLLFALLMDPWIAKINSPTGNPDLQTVINALNDPTSQAMFNSSAYVPEKFVLDFNIGVDMTALQAQFPTLNFLAQGTGFAWPSINMTIANSEQRNQACVTNLQTQHNNAAMKIPAVCLRFMDAGQPTPVGVNLSAWTGTRDYATSVWGGQPSRVLDMQAGKLFFDSFNTVPGACPYLGFVTWNDFDEGTDVEAFYAMLSGIRIGS
jgi:hypothetical protein